MGIGAVVALLGCLASCWILIVGVTAVSSGLVWSRLVPELLRTTGHEAEWEPGRGWP